MKKFILLIAIMNCAFLLAQNKVAKRVAELQTLNVKFNTVSVLNPVQNVTNIEVDKVVEESTLATIDMVKVNEIYANKYDYIELEIPYKNQIIPVLLYKENPFAEGFHVDTDKGRNIAYQKGVFYRGIIEGQTNSVSSFSFFNGEFNGIISSNELGNLVIGKLEKANNQTDYIVYSDAKMKVLNQFDCHVKEGTFTPKVNSKTNKNTLSDRCVTVYFEIDNNIYTNFSSNITTTTNWMTSVFNNIQTLYDNDGISVALKSIYIWTEADPYEGIGTSSSDYLQAFGAQRPVFDGDLGALVGKDPGGLGGVAITINGLCSQSNYCYSDVDYTYSTVPTYSWTIQVISHELGHLFGSPHTHGCYWNGDNTVIDGCGQQAGYNEGNCAQGPIPSAAEKGTIMSYCHLVNGVGINFNNGFGPQPAQLILDTVNASTCLSTDCINTCINTVADISVDSITPSSAIISWTDDVSTSWEISVTPFSSSTLNWVTVDTNNYLAAGLNANTYYVVRIRPLCVDIVPTNREKIFATTSSNFCAGVSFTDTGGTSGQYTNNQTWVRTMTPYNSGLKLKVTFSSFNLEANYDYLYIYNGPTEFNNDLTLGGLTGASIPSPFNSTSAEGSLTFKFVSDEGVTAAGWNASITCTGTLGEESNDFLDFSYYPNPTSGKVTITSKDVITEITVYNIEGQLLFSQKLNELNSNVDLSKFASGTYFFKLKFNDKEANFKVLKM